jgi:hypothetical protein
MRIAIIGTAGRRGDRDRITLATWSSMIADARQRVEVDLCISRITTGLFR